MFLIFNVSGVNDIKLIISLSVHQMKKQLNVNERHLFQFRPSGVLGNYEVKNSAPLLNESVLIIIMELWNHLTNVNESSINTSGITKNSKVMLFCFSFVHYSLKPSCIWQILS